MSEETYLITYYTMTSAVITQTISNSDDAFKEFKRIENEEPWIQLKMERVETTLLIDRQRVPSKVGTPYQINTTGELDQGIKDLIIDVLNG